MANLPNISFKLILRRAIHLPNRFRRWLHAILVAVDQLAYVILAGPYFLIVGGDEPSARETISSKVGREANNGWLWARLAEKGIDALFVLLGSEWGHCQRAILAPCVIAGGNLCGVARLDAAEGQEGPFPPI